MPFCALITTSAVSTAASAPIACPAKSGKPGVSSKWINTPCQEKLASAEFSEWPNSFSLRIEIANGVALFDGAPAADGAGCGEQAFGKRRLAGGTVADESDSAKVTGGGLAHSSSPIQVERKPQLQK
jgi:hypothetical protein